MDFVAIDTDIAGDRVTIELARALKVKRAHAAGLLVLTFAGMAKHAQDGCLDGVLDEQIEEWAYWHGRPGDYAAFVRANLCDANGLVTAWERWNGKMIARAKAERERLRQYREDRSAQRARTRTVHVREPYANGTANPVPDLTRPDQTKPSTQTTALSPMNPAKVAGRGGWPAAVAEQWTRSVGVIQPGRVGKDLAPFVRLYPSGLDALDACVRAVTEYAEHCRRNDAVPKWPQFVAEIRRHIPRTMLPPTTGAAA